MPFTAEHLLDLLEPLVSVPASSRLWIGYSGGLDSRVLLHHLVGMRKSIPEIAGAVHVHHGLSRNADQWADFCQSTCKTYSLPCRVIDVNAAPQKDESPEQAARRARYEAFSDVMETGDVLLLAHHQDDQAETFLYQAIRGSGPHGLSAMPGIKVFANGYIARPMLNADRQTIRGYAEKNQLEWVEDESNRDTSLDRNYLREVIFPELRSRWPAVSRTLSRAARHTASLTHEADKLLAERLADIRGQHPATLSIQALSQQSPNMAALLVRTWVRQLGLTPPASDHMRELLGSQLNAARDKQVLVNWDNVEIRRYQDDLYAMKTPVDINTTGWQHEWLVSEAIDISELGGILEASRTVGAGLAAKYCDQALLVRPRSGGEECRPANRAHHHDLKRLYQEARIPPWERPRLPLIYVDDNLAAVAGQWICHEFLAGQGEPGYQISWSLYR